MKNLKHLALCLAAAFVATACSNDYPEVKAPAKDGKPVKFEMNIGKATGRTITQGDGNTSNRIVDWREGDAVGIFAYNQAEALFSNVKYVYENNEWKPAGVEAIELAEGETYSFYAYYPYSDNVTSPTAAGLSVLTDQSAAGEGENSSYDLSDILTSRLENEVNNGTVALNYSHLFSMVEAVVSGDLVTQAPASVILKNVQTAASANLTTGEVIATSTPADVTMCPIAGDNENAYLYRAIVPAQTIAANEILLEVHGVGENADKNYEFHYTADVTYEKGKYRRMSVLIGKNNTGITIPGGSIDEWQPSDEIKVPGDEIIETATSIDLSFNAATQVEVKKAYKDEKLTDAANYWFTRTEATQISFNETEGAMEIKSGNANRLTWDSSSFGFHFGSNPLEMGSYELTFMARTTDTSTGQQLGITFRDATDCTAFKVTNQFNGNRVQIGYKLTQEWQECKFVIDLGTAASKTGLANIPTEDVDPEGCFKPTTAENINGISIILWKNVAADYSIFFKDMKFEKVTE